MACSNAEESDLLASHGDKADGEQQTAQVNDTAQDLSLHGNQNVHNSLRKHSNAHH